MTLYWLSIAACALATASAFHNALRADRQRRQDNRP